MKLLPENRYLRWSLLASSFVFVMWLAILQDIQVLLARMPHEMVELCETAGVQIYEQVEDVRSFAIVPWVQDRSLSQIAAGERPDTYLTEGCFPCLKELVADKYEAVESYYVGPSDRPSDWNYVGHGMSYASSTGLYRLRLEDRRLGNDLCKPFDDLVAFAEANKENRKLATNLRVFLRGYSEVREDLAQFCIVAERIDEFSAPYKVQQGFQTRFRPTTFFGGMNEFIHNGARVVRLSDGKVLAEANSFYYEFDHLGGTNARCGIRALPSISTILNPVNQHAEERRN